ncbi:hypothetical protein [Kitasatospora sp. NPDC018619]|uniref:hypothetical protein n=1 Tax=unclassified Kitasatospora TaxID=2633591 RepID=UPI00378DA8D0
MIVARVVQDTGGAVVPLAFGIVRDELPVWLVALLLAVSEGRRRGGGSLRIMGLCTTAVVFAGSRASTTPSTCSSTTSAMRTIRCPGWGSAFAATRRSS